MAATDVFAGTKNKQGLGSASPPLVWGPITTSDSDQTVTYRIVKVYGSAGDIKLRNAADDSDFTLPNVPNQGEIVGCFSRIWQTGTAATSLFGAT